MDTAARERQIEEKLKAEREALVSEMRSTKEDKFVEFFCLYSS